MPALIQILNMPDDLHRQLKFRASLAAMSLSDDLRARLDGRSKTEPALAPADAAAPNASGLDGCP